MLKELGIGEGSIIKKIDRLNNIFRQIQIGNDIDNTEVATSANGVLIVNRIFGTNFKPSDLKYDFAIVDLIKNVPGITDPAKTASDIWNSIENISKSLPVPGALEVSKLLYENDIKRVYRITSRPGKLQNATLSWYEANMPWVDRNLIRIQPDGNEINSLFKINQIKELKINLFFEDSVNHAETIIDMTVPEDYCPTQPAFIRAYLWLAEVYY